MDQLKPELQPIVDIEEPTSNAKDLLKLIGLMLVSVLAAWLAMAVWDFVT
jgi:hypothetical protein